MIITATKSLRKSLIQLYIDGEEAMQVDKETFLISPYSQGSEIDDEQLFELIKNSEYKRAKERAFYLLGIKNYSRKMLYKKLIEVASEETAELVCDKMVELGIVNDLNYASIYARDLFNIKKFGKNRVRTELFRKGIPKEIIDEVLEEEHEESHENIKAILDKKYPLWDEDMAVKRRAFAFLMRRGYTSREISAVMHEMYEYYD